MEETTEVAEELGRDRHRDRKAQDDLDSAFADVFIWLFAFCGSNEIDLALNLEERYGQQCGGACGGTSFCVCILRERASEEVVRALTDIHSAQQRLGLPDTTLFGWETRLRALYAISNLVHDEQRILLKLMEHVGDAAKEMRRRTKGWKDRVGVEAAHTFAWAVALFARAYPRGERSIAEVINQKYPGMRCHKCGASECHCWQVLATSLLLCVAGTEIDGRTHTEQIQKLSEGPMRDGISVTTRILEHIAAPHLLKELKESQAIVFVQARPTAGADFVGALWTARAARKPGGLLIRRSLAAAAELATFAREWGDARFLVDDYEAADLPERYLRILSACTGESQV